MDISQNFSILICLILNLAKDFGLFNQKNENQPFNPIIRTDMKNILITLLFVGFYFNCTVTYSQCVPRSGFFWGEMLPNNGCGNFASYSSFGPGEYFRMPVLLGGSYRISTCGNNMDTQITGFQGTTTTTHIFYNDDNGSDCSGTEASIDFIPNFTDYVRVNVNQFNCLPGGSFSITVKVRQNNNLAFTSSSANMCQGQTRTLTATPAPVGGSPPLGSGNLGTFSGTGVSGTTFTAPVPAGSSAVYTITYTFGYCSTTQNITVFKNPSTSSAGPDQTVCSSTATLAGNNPAVGTGAWSVIEGPGTVTTPGSPNSTVTGLLASTPTKLAWTISNGPCTVSSDNVVINRDANPTPANAGPNQTVCSSSATLAGNTPSVGTGQWSLVGGSGSITTPSSPTSGVTGLGLGSNTFRWTITNGVCPPSTDDVVITRDQEPTTANAGPDQAICDDSTDLAGNSPTVGSGTWSLIGGSGTITNVNDPTTSVTNLGVGTDTFAWTITNGVCPPSSDTVFITSDLNPTPANAGPDQTICDDSTDLAGNTPSVGIGTWSLIGGSGAITDPNNPASPVTGLGIGANAFEWSITNGVCPASKDTVVITQDELPTAADAGPDQTICDDSTDLAGNTPSVGIGTWSLIGGSGAITDPNNPASPVTSLGIGANTFEWSITNGVCPASKDTVVIALDELPTVADAGPDQTVCDDSTDLAGNTPSVGIGTWSLIGGSGSITDPNNPASPVTGLGIGANTFEWSITNGVCPASKDTVVIALDELPTTADAGPDQNVCDDSTDLAGNTPSVGIGTWSLIGGSGSITDPNNPASPVTGLGIGTNTFEWSIANGVCPASKDTVVITQDELPTTANAGPDQSVCADNAVLEGKYACCGNWHLEPNWW